MFHRIIRMQYKEGMQAGADRLLAAFQALPERVEGLESVSIHGPQEGFDVGVDLAFATWQAREGCALDGFYQAALSWARELSASLECRDSPTGGHVPDAGMPLRWHKFLVCFALWAEALGLMLAALQFLGNSKPMFGISATYTAVSLLAVFFSLGVFGIAILQLFACWALAHFRRNGPKLLLWGNAAAPAWGIAALLAAHLIIGMPFLPDVLWAVLAQAALTVGNQAYYRRRAALFVN